MLFLVVLALLGVGATGLAVEELDEENQVGDEALIFGADPAVVRDKAQQAFENTPKPPFLSVKLHDGGTETYARPTDDELEAVGYPRSKPQAPALTADPSTSSTAELAVGNSQTAAAATNPVTAFVQQMSVGLFNASPAAFTPPTTASTAPASPPSLSAAPTTTTSSSSSSSSPALLAATVSGELADGEQAGATPDLSQPQQQQSEQDSTAAQQPQADDGTGASTINALAAQSSPSSSSESLSSSSGTASSSSPFSASEAASAAAEAVAEAAAAMELTHDLAATAAAKSPPSSPSSPSTAAEEEKESVGAGEKKGNESSHSGDNEAASSSSSSSSSGAALEAAAPMSQEVGEEDNEGVRGDCIVESFKGVLCLSDGTNGCGGGGGGCGGGGGGGNRSGLLLNARGSILKASAHHPGGGVLVAKGAAAAASNSNNNQGGAGAAAAAAAEGNDFAAENKAAVMRFRQAQKDAALKAAGDQLCLLCFDATHDAVFLGCGHGGACYQCAVDTFVRNRGLCPFCRAPVDQIVTINPNETGVHPNGSTMVKVTGPNRSIFALLGVRHGDFGISV